MGNIIRPELVKFMGKEHEDTEQFLRTLRGNRSMGLTLLRRKGLFESFYALAEADGEYAGYWEEIAKECNRLYEELWEEKIKDGEAWEALVQVLQLPMPEKPPTMEELREKMISSLQGQGMNEIISRIKKALDTEEWKDLFTEEAYKKLKEMYSLRCTEDFLQCLEKKYILYTTKDMRGGGVKKTASAYVEEWCMNVAAEYLVRKEEGYLLDEKVWNALYDAERNELLANLFFHTAAELLEGWDKVLLQEPGSTLQNSCGYEKCKPSLELEERKLAALEEAYSRLTICRTKFADGTWFELWENSEPQSVERMAFFLLAAGKVNDDRTDFDRIWKAESGMKYSDAEYEELGRWYWNYGIRLARWTREVKNENGEYGGQVGYFWIAGSAKDAVRYILNELSKWKKLSRVTSESIKEYACAKLCETGIYENKKLLESCEEYIKKRQEDIDTMFHLTGPWSCIFEKKKNIDLLFDKKKKQYYLATSNRQRYRGISANYCFDVMKSMAMYHRYHKWRRIFRYVTFGPNRKKQKSYLRLFKSIDGISLAKVSCERFVEKRKKLHEKMRVECKKMREKEKMFTESVPRSYTEIRCGGLFNYWEEQWNDLKRSYEEFTRTRTEWEKEESAHWEKEVREFEKNCETYRKRMSNTFDDCYCLLELRKERRKKRWGLKRRIKTIKPSRKEKSHKKAKGRSARHCFSFRRLFRKKR